MSKHFRTFHRWKAEVVQVSSAELLRQVARGVAIGLGIIIAVWLFGRGYRAIVLARGRHIGWPLSLQPYLISAAVAA